MVEVGLVVLSHRPDRQAARPFGPARFVPAAVRLFISAQHRALRRRRDQELWRAQDRRKLQHRPPRHPGRAPWPGARPQRQYRHRGVDLDRGARSQRSGFRDRGRQSRRRGLCLAQLACRDSSRRADRRGLRGRRRRGRHQGYAGLVDRRRRAGGRDRSA